MVDLASLPYFIKICGVTSSNDARVVVDAGANALGLILAQSSRRVDLHTAVDISHLVEGAILRVGVFRDNDVDFVLRAQDEAQFDMVQVHGPLHEELRCELRARKTLIIKALAVGTTEFADFDDSLVDAVLVDGAHPGSGETHSWDVQDSRGWSRPLIAAGGLTPLNVYEVLATTAMWGCDVATGVESARGIKNAQSVQLFVENAKRYFEQQGERHG